MRAGRRVTCPPWPCAALVTESRVSSYLTLLAGALLFGLLHFIPVVGELSFLLVALTGAGAVLATRFGRSTTRGT